MAAADNYPQADSESRHNAEVRSAVGGCFPATTFIILTNQKWQLYRLQGTRTNLFGKTPSNTIGSAGNELWGSMDDADKSSAPSIPWPGCMPRRSSCYGRCFARSVPPDAALVILLWKVLCAKRAAGCGTAAREAKTGDKPPSPTVRIRHTFRCDLQSAGM